MKKIDGRATTEYNRHIWQKCIAECIALIDATYSLLKIESLSSCTRRLSRDASSCRRHVDQRYCKVFLATAHSKAGHSSNDWQLLL